MSSLAINGGTKAVTVKPKENWKEPPLVQKVNQLVCQMIDEGIWSQCGQGIFLEFEEKFKEYIGTKYCLSQNNGTSIVSGFVF